MKKFFTLTLALMASFSLWASSSVSHTFASTDVFTDNTINVNADVYLTKRANHTSSLFNGNNFYIGSNDNYICVNVKSGNTIDSIKVTTYTAGSEVASGKAFSYGAANSYFSPSSSAGSFTYAGKIAFGNASKVTGSGNLLGTAKVDVTSVTGCVSVVLGRKIGGTGDGTTFAVGKIEVFYTPATSAPAFTSPASEPETVYYEQNQEADQLSVTATGGPAPTLQWYSNTTKSTEGAEPIENETNATYTPSTATAGDFYYYCVATNTSGTATSYFFHINVAEATCPAGMTINGEDEYSERTDIELTASLTEGNGEITYNWYKGEDLAAAKAAGSIGTGTTYSKASCAKSDAGNYFCVATKADCSEAASEAFEVTITDYVCPTSGVLFALTMKDNLANISLNANTEMEITTEYATILNGSAILRNNDGNDGKAQIKDSHIYFNGAQAYVKVEMTCGPLASGDTIAFTSTSYENELWLTNTNSNSNHVETSGRKHVVAKDDLLDGKSVFYVWRKSGATYVKTMKVIRPAGSATGIENQESEIDNRKFIKDGQLFIEKNGHVYNVFGACIK